MRAVGDQLLEKAHKDFLEKAGERFTEADKNSQAKLQNLLQPVEATLKRYEEGLQRVEKERVDQYSGLKAVIDQVREGQGRVRDETRNLVNALRSSPKARGRWGEQSLRNVLEQAGLIEYADFATEVSVNTEDGRLRPDVIVNLPGAGNWSSTPNARSTPFSTRRKKSMTSAASRTSTPMSRRFAITLSNWDRRITGPNSAMPPIMS